jgi:hypothetical protein
VAVDFLMAVDLLKVAELQDLQTLFLTRSD